MRILKFTIGSRFYFEGLDPLLSEQLELFLASFVTAAWLLDDSIFNTDVKTWRKNSGISSILEAVVNVVFHWII